MRNLRRHVPVAFALMAAVFSTSCSGLLWHKRTIGWLRHAKGPNGGGSPTLMMATRDQLNERLAAHCNAISSFQATVDMAPSIGSVYKGQITDIKDIRAFVLFRKPAEIRIIGKVPVVGSQAFDMVSDGANFSVFLNSKNLFVEGANSAPPVSPNKFENLRPDVFLSSMMMCPADPATETTALEDSTDEDTAIFVLHFLRKNSKGEIYIHRNVWFDRLDLSIVRQKVLDEDGLILSDTRYAKWQPYNGVAFPSHIDINRPKDGYGVIMDITQMQMNKELTNAQFELKRPEGSQLKVIGEPGSR